MPLPPLELHEKGVLISVRTLPRTGTPSPLEQELGAVRRNVEDATKAFPQTPSFRYQCQIDQVTNSDGHSYSFGKIEAISDFPVVFEEHEKSLREFHERFDTLVRMIDASLSKIGYETLYTPQLR